MEWGDEMMVVPPHQRIKSDMNDANDDNQNNSTI